MFKRRTWTIETWCMDKSLNQVFQFECYLPVFIMQWIMNCILKTKLNRNLPSDITLITMWTYLDWDEKNAYEFRLFETNRHKD
jgi:hypothetical protein